VDGVKRKMVPAVPIEQCVLQLVREIISAEDSIRKSVLNYVKQETASISELERNSQYLRDEQEKLECKIGYLYDRVTTPASKAVTEKKIAEVEMQLTTVNKQLKKAQGEYPAALRDAEGAADAVVKQLAAIGQDLDSQSVSSLHKLLDHLIEKIEIDIEKSEIDLSFRLPHTSVWTAFEISRNGCAVPKADPMCRNSTNTGNSLYLADYHCKQEGNTQNHCWKCSRKMYMRMATGAIAA
jgi:ribosome recycling factor